MGGGAAGGLRTLDGRKEAAALGGAKHDVGDVFDGFVVVEG